MSDDRVIAASEVPAKIKAGEPAEFDNYTIVGDLNLSALKIEEAVLVSHDNDTLAILLPLRSRSVRLVSPDNGDSSAIWLLSRSSSVRLVSLDNGDTSTIWLLPRPSSVRLVSPDSGDTSTIWLP